MATPPEAVRRGLQVLIGAAVADATGLLGRGDGEDVRGDLLVTVPAVTAAYISGSSALALDWYEELREESRTTARFTPRLVEWDRAEKFGNAVAWATTPLVDEEPNRLEVTRRLSVVIDSEVQGGFTGTITDNTNRDPAAVGWKRIARPGACKLCTMLASRGAVYKESTARFAAHTGGPKGGGPCHCTAAPVFSGGDVGPEASVEQYRASRRRTTAADRERLRAYLNENFPDAPG